MNPWKQKEIIDLVWAAADRNGFRLSPHPHFDLRICLFTKGANEHGFVNDIPLQAFDSWETANAFFLGWEKNDLAQAVARSLKGKKK